MKESIKQGQDSATRHLKAVHPYLETLSTEEKLLWWSGFIGAVFGCAGASIGGEAVTAIYSTTGPMLAEVVRAHSN